MKLPVLHNFNAIKGEVISLNIGYNNVVASESLFACVRKYSPDEDYKAKFDIGVSTDELESDEASKITLSLDTNALEVGKYQWDLFIWSGGQVTSQPIEIYEVVWGNAKAGAYGADRGYLAFDPLTGWGYLHFDFNLTNPSGNGGMVAQLPPNAPVAVRLIEKSVNVNNNSVYVEKNSRIIKAWGVPANTRYIIDIIGFWRKG